MDVFSLEIFFFFFDIAKNVNLCIQKKKTIELTSFIFFSLSQISPALGSIIFAIFRKFP